MRDRKWILLNLLPFEVQMWKCEMYYAARYGLKTVASQQTTWYPCMRHVPSTCCTMGAAKNPISASHFNEILTMHRESLSRPCTRKGSFGVVPHASRIYKILKEIIWCGAEKLHRGTSCTSDFCQFAGGSVREGISLKRVNQEKNENLKIEFDMPGIMLLVYWHSENTY